MRHLVLIWILLASAGMAQSYPAQARFPAPEAKQGVAVDEGFFYAIDNEQIGKYEKSSGRQVGHWRAGPEHSLVHMNSGVVVKGKLYCAHSTWPHHPWASSIEVFDCQTLTHERSISLGLRDGALNWVDFHDGQWWAVFVHYEHDVPHHHPEYVGRTKLVRMDDQWRTLESWLFPPDLLERFRPASNSGGSWGSDGKLYCTGHDHAELYQLELPKTGSILKFTGTVPAELTGQAFSWDRSVPGVLYGIDRPKSEVTRCGIPLKSWDI